MGVTLTTISFDIVGNGSAYEFTVDPDKKEIVKGRISEKIQTGINVFDKASVEADIENETNVNKISYTLSFGDTKTRNGVLQLLKGYLQVAIEDGKYYVVNPDDSLSHSSYTVDLGVIELRQEGDKLKVTK